MLELVPRGFKYIVCLSPCTPSFIDRATDRAIGDSDDDGESGPGGTVRRLYCTLSSGVYTDRPTDRGRADMSCHWEDTDTAIQEMFSNVSSWLVLT